MDAAALLAKAIERAGTFQTEAGRCIRVQSMFAPEKECDAALMPLRDAAIDLRDEIDRLLAEIELHFST